MTMLLGTFILNDVSKQDDMHSPGYIMQQFQIGIECYSVTYLKCIIKFDML